MKEKTLILKFGGAAVKKSARFLPIAALIQEHQSTYPRIVVVVSAMGEMTDELTSLAKKVHPSPPKREYDMLVSAGERISISLLAMALERKGIEAMSFTGSQSGICTCTRHSDARIIDVRPERIIQCLQEGKIAIVAGFQGVSRDKEITTLGRGGSDTTAAALGVALQAEEVIYYKDVPGIFAEDPKHNPAAKKYSSLSYEDALAIMYRSKKMVLHPRCLLLAKKNRLPLRILSFQEIGKGTMIGEGRGSETPQYEEME